MARASRAIKVNADLEDGNDEEVEECNVRPGMQGLTKYLISFQKISLIRIIRLTLVCALTGKGRKNTKVWWNYLFQLVMHSEKFSSIQTIPSILTCFLQRSMVTRSMFHWKAKATGHVQTITTMVHGMTGL